MWILFALVSAVLTAFIGTLTKAGLARTDPVLGLAVQATVLVVLAWVAVAVRGQLPKLALVDAKSWGLLLASGVGMVVAYFFYFSALAAGPSSGAQPLDRLSLVFAVLFAGLLLKEKITPVMIGGVALMAVGAVMIAVGSPKESGGEVRAANLKISSLGEPGKLG